MVYDRNLQSDHCYEAPSWTGRWFSPKGDRWWRVWSCEAHTDGLTGLREFGSRRLNGVALGWGDWLAQLPGRNPCAGVVHSHPQTRSRRCQRKTFRTIAKSRGTQCLTAFSSPLLVNSTW